jgi:SAM-dependent methyltransferase
VLDVPSHAQPVTPASVVAIRGVASHLDLLAGVGVDWGTGTGGLAIAAALGSEVEQVIAIDLDEANLAATRANAAVNDVAAKVVTVHADGFTPLDVRAGDVLARLVGSAGFLVANPPGDPGDDGLGWRRRVLVEAAALLRHGAPVLLQISRQYGRHRITGLADTASLYRYEGCVAAGDWERFDLTRPDLAELAHRYAAVERSGGAPYMFRLEGGIAGQETTAVGAVEAYEVTGSSPLTKWQLHLFRRT